MTTSNTLDVSAEYRAARQRLSERAARLDEEQLARRVPACPAWTVREVLCHLAGAADDVTNGNLAGAPGESWTAEHVAARRDRPLADVIAEWGATADRLEPMMAANPEPLTMLLADVVSHEQDIRVALEEPSAADAAVAEAVARQFGAIAEGRAAAAGLAPLRVRVAADGEADPAHGGDTVTLTFPSAFELLRASTGRRSLAQLRQLDWGGADPEPYLDSISVFAPRADPLTEA